MLAVTCIVQEHQSKLDWIEHECILSSPWSATYHKGTGSIDIGSGGSS